jgi:hypothetical protein
VSRREPLPGVGAIVAAALLMAGCSEPAPTRAPITFQGAISGVYHAGPPSECGRGVTTVTGAIGSDSSDTADLAVSDSGTVQVSSNRFGDFSGRGVAFRPPIGWDIDAELTGRTGGKLIVRGHLPC